MTDEKREMGRASLILSVCTFLSRILGLVRNQILGHFFGAGVAADAFIAAFTIPNALRRLFGEGALTPAFVSLITREIHGDRKDWQSFLSASFFWLGAVTGIITLLGMLLSPFLVLLYVPEFRDTPGKFELTIVLTQILFPFLMLISWAALFMGALNSFKKFASSALGPAAMNLTVVIVAPLCFLVIFPDSPYKIHIYALTNLLGAIVQLLIVIPDLKKIGALPNFRFQWKDPRVFELFTLLVPSVFGMGIYQLNIIINRVFASDIPGAVSHLYYADLLIELPVSLIATSMGVAAVPSFSRLVQSKKFAELGDSFRFSFNLNLFLAVPAAMGLLILAGPIVSTIYYTGKFQWEDVTDTQACLIAYAVGLPVFCLIRSLLPLYFAEKDTRTPAIIGAVALVANLIAAWQLSTRFGGPGIAMATSISSSVNFALLLFLVLRKYPDFPWKKILLQIGKVTICAFVMAAVLWLLRTFVFTEVWEESGIRLAKISALLVFVLAGAITYFASAQMVGLAEARFFADKIKHKLSKNK